LILDLRQNSRFNPEGFDTLKKISFSKGGDFNNLIGKISETLFDRLDWWVGLPASRNTLQSPLFYRFCCLYLVNDLIQSGTSIEKVIVDSTALARIINDLKKEEGLNFEIEGPASELPNSHYYLWKSIDPFLEAWKRKRAQFRAARKTKHLSSNQPKNSLILIDQFIFPGFITKERYYNGLWDALTLEQREKTFFVPTLVMMKEEEFEPAYRELRTSERNFLIKEDYLTFSALLFSLFHIFRVWFIKPPPQEVMGIDFSPLIREELLSGGGYESALEGLLNYRFAKRLKERSFDLSLVIDWWEGQPLDKGWNLGFHTYFPNTPRKGYLGYAPRTMELQLRPSESEIQYGAAPETISTIGEQFSSDMESTKPPFQTETAPAFRFGHLWENGSSNERDSGIFKILLALSIMVDESIRILEQVIDSELVEDDQMKFILKPHPTVQFDTLKKRMGDNWSSRFQESENSTPDEIRSSDLLITGMSSVGLEAIVMGVPVIVVERMSGLAYDPIPDSVPKELWRSCRSPKEISEAIDTFRNRTPEEVIKHRALSAQIKRDYFEPVTEEGVCTFLELEV
jgi:hypothetical protein